MITAFSAFSQRLVNVPVYPLQSLSSDSSNKWLAEVFDARITDDIRFLGLGEFSHGGNETILFKAKMIQYLVKTKGYRKLLMEYPNVLIQPLGDYLNRKSSVNLDSVQLIAQGLFGRSFIGNTSFYGLMTWLKQYNLAHPDDMVNLCGIDTEGASGAFADYFMSGFLLPADRPYALEVLSRWEHVSKDSVVAAELRWFHEHEQMLEQWIGKVAFQRLGYNVKAAENKLTHGSLQKINMYKASAFRDSVMAATIASFDDSKAIIWAHNIHITTSDQVVSLGNYLKKAVGKQYYTVVTDFSSSAMVWAISPKGEFLSKIYQSDKTTVSYLLNKKTGIDQGIVFFKDLNPNQVKFNNIDNSGNHIVIGKGHPFDALVILDKVEPFVFR